jgi:hypothetical protein
MAIGSFKLPISTSTSPAQWTKPAEWIDISTVGDNEINLLVSDGTGISFATTVASSGTYTIDWGDGTVETGRASGTTYQHQYNYSGGTYCANLGYWVYKVRIYGATGNITRWQVKRHSFTTRKQYLNILWAVFGTTALTDCSSTFYDTVGLTAVCQKLQACTLPTSWGSVSNTSYMFNNCSSLSSIVLPTSWGSVTTTSYMFNNCSSLSSIVLPTSWGSVSNTSYMFAYCSSLSSIVLPTSWGSVSNTQGMFYNCYALSSIVLPTSWGSVTTTSYMFNNCSSLSSIVLPTSWGSVSNTSFMFYNCYALSSIVLPTSWGSVSNTQGMFYNCYALSSIVLPTSWGSVTTVLSMFNGCYSLKTITGLDYLGHQSLATNGTDLLKDCQYLQGTLTVAAFLSKIGIYGTSAYLLQCTGIRLTNANSTFGGTSPQVNVSYTSLDATALNTLFGDLPTLTGKTITITGCPGAATCDTSIATAKGWTVIN